VYVRPEVDGEPTTFGVSGKLWRDSLVMYDRASLSLWSQVQGSAVAGEQTVTAFLRSTDDRVLTFEFAGTPVYWAVWVRHYPQTRILEAVGSR
jgi:hypothetical protein